MGTRCAGEICDGLNICVPPSPLNSHVEALTHNVMIFGEVTRFR